MLEIYHLDENFFPDLKNIDSINLNPKDRELIEKISYNIEYIGKNLSNPDVNFYIDQYFKSKNLFFRNLYFLFLQYSEFCQSRLQDMMSAIVDKFPILFTHLLKNEFDNLQLLIYFYQTYVKSCNKLEKTQNTFDNCVRFSRIQSKSVDTIRFDLFYQLLPIPYKYRKNITISEHFYGLILDWIERHDGNTTCHIFEELDLITRFLEQENKKELITQIKEIIGPKLILFIDKVLEEEHLDNDNAQHLMLKKRFLDQKLTIYKKYVSDKSAENKVKLEVEQISKNISTAKTGFIHRTNTIKINKDEFDLEINNITQNRNESQIVKFMTSDQMVIPDEPNDNDFFDILGLAGQVIFDSNGDVKHINSKDKVITQQGGFNPLAKWTIYQQKLEVSILFWKRIVQKYDREKIKDTIKLNIEKSPRFSSISKIIFNKTIEFYFQSDFFCCINSSIFQIEAVLRQLCYANSQSTRVMVKDRERTSGFTLILNCLKEIESKFPQDLLCLIKWLLQDEIDQIGKNLRNKIAHGISDEQTYQNIYTESNAILLIIIILKLSVV